MSNVLVNLNGQIIDPARDPQGARVPVLDRSYLYGDSLYEVCRSIRGRLLDLDAHLNRLKRSAELCRMTLSQNLEEYAREMVRTTETYLKTHPGEEVYCRLVVSRGVGRIGFSLSSLESGTQYAIIVQKLNLPTDQQLRDGLSLRVSDRIRNPRDALDPAMKSGNYLNSLLAFLDAEENGFDDAILCDSEGFLTEGTTFNLFYVRRGIVVTPPTSVGILHGITRAGVLRVAREIGLPTREVDFPKERLYEADEVFITSTTKDAFPVTRVDQHRIGNGKPGPITLKLREAFQQWTQSCV